MRFDDDNNQSPGSPPPRPARDDQADDEGRFRQAPRSITPTDLVALRILYRKSEFEMVAHGQTRSGFEK
ncbi:hypothetical protein S40285_10871, partial [Stachybotrys chlorohalonatus IBT 40285]